MKYAIYHWTLPSMKGCSQVWAQNAEEYLSNQSDRVRVSEWVEVEFPPCDPAQFVPQQIAAIDAQIAEVNRRAGLAIADLEARKAELLAITDKREIA